MSRARKVARWLALVLVVVFVGRCIAGVMAYRFTDTGTLAVYGVVGFGATCLGIDLDGDAPGVRAIEHWPAELYADVDHGAVVDRGGRMIVAVGDRVRVAASLIRQHGDIDPCSASERLTIESIEVIGRASPAPGPSSS
jgi:hypothetical protein